MVTIPSLTNTSQALATAGLTNRDFSFYFGSVNLADKGSSIDNMPDASMLNDVLGKTNDFTKLFLLASVGIAGIILLGKKK